MQNPYYFMFASLAKPDADNELHWLKVGISFVITYSTRQSPCSLRYPAVIHVQRSYGLDHRLPVLMGGRLMIALQATPCPVKLLPNSAHYGGR
jgi:hypothetical protein